MSGVERLRTWARTIRRDAVALWFAARDPRTPRPAKILAALVAAYALSPIDLIPDFIPIIGYLDDLVLVPIGIVVVVRMIPPPLMAEFRTTAGQVIQRPVSRTAAVVFVVAWLCAVAALGYAVISWLAVAHGPR